MLPLPEISNTECVNFNDAIVWVALQIFPTNKFEPNDKGTLEWLQMIDFDKWAYENNMHDPLVYTPDICKEYKLPENIELKYIEAYKEEPSNPDLINYLLKDQSISKEEKEKLKAQLSEATEFYNKSLHVVEAREKNAWLPVEGDDDFLIDYKHSVCLDSDKILKSITIKNAQNEKLKAKLLHFNNGTTVMWFDDGTIIKQSTKK